MVRRRSSRRLAVAVILAAAVAAAPARASVELGLGADYWFRPDNGLFNLTLAIRRGLGSNFSVGGRFGAFITSGPTDLGVPIDLAFRASVSRIYLEGLVGPWILFHDRPVRAHAAFGFGLRGGGLTFGAELGYLDPSPIIGVRLAFRL